MGLHGCQRPERLVSGSDRSMFMPECSPGKWRSVGHRTSHAEHPPSTKVSGSTAAVRLTGRVWGRYHGGRRPSGGDSFHSPTVISPLALDKPSITKRYCRRRTCCHTSPRRSPTTVTLHDIRFVECRWWSDGWTVKTVVT